jgi:SAM-dependent methyltransferase
MTDSALATYYADQVSNERLQRGQQVFAQASLAALKRLTPLPRLHRTLDVGAGYGYLLASLRARHGIDGVGVEPSEVESEYARSHLGVDMRTTLLSHAGLAPSSYDLVYAFEVLEHTMQPRAFMAELAEYVAPGGFLVIGTDNFESAVVRDLGPAFPKWIPHTHISHFSPRTLTRLMRQLDDFDIAGYTSYTPWEFIARSAVSRVRRPPDLADTYDLASGIHSEVARSFKYYHLRNAITTAWFAWNATDDLSGEMMFIAMQRRQ